MTDNPHLPSDTAAVAGRLRTALASGDLAAFGALLDEQVRWGGEHDTPETCHGRTDVVNRLARQQQAGMRTSVIDVIPGSDAVLLALHVSWPVTDGFARERSVYQVLKVRNQRIVDIRSYPNLAEAASHAGIASSSQSESRPASVQARDVVPILNVSNLPDSFEWFARLGWSRIWDWRAADGPPSFGAIASGSHQIFLCLNGQGGRGREPGIGGGGQGVWLSIWVDDVDAVNAICTREHFEVLQPPRDEPWGVREMHLRHPDGHVLRITAPLAHAH